MGTAVGGTRPFPPVDVAVASEKNVVNSPDPLVTEAGTKVGGPPTTPPPPMMVLVEDPEMIVVVAPFMIVVIKIDSLASAEVTGCCTIVCVKVFVHAQDVP